MSDSALRTFFLGVVIGVVVPFMVILVLVRPAGVDNDDGVVYRDVTTMQNGVLHCSFVDFGKTVVFVGCERLLQP